MGHPSNHPEVSGEKKLAFLLENGLGFEELRGKEWSGLPAATQYAVEREYDRLAQAIKQALSQDRAAEGIESGDEDDDAPLDEEGEDEEE